MTDCVSSLSRFLPHCTSPLQIAEVLTPAVVLRFIAANEISGSFAPRRGIAPDAGELNARASHRLRANQTSVVQVGLLEPLTPSSAHPIPNSAVCDCLKCRIKLASVSTDLPIVNNEALPLWD
jgi:hypothetical protein